MGKRAKQKQQLDSYTQASDLVDSDSKSKKTKFTNHELKKRERSLQKEMVRKIQNILDHDTQEEQKHVNRIIYTIKPVE